MKNNRAWVVVVSMVLTGVLFVPTWAVETDACPGEMRVIFAGFQMDERSISELGDSDHAMSLVRSARQMGNMEVKLRLEDVSSPKSCKYEAVGRGNVSAFLSIRGKRGILETIFRQRGESAEVRIHTAIAEYSREKLIVEKSSSLHIAWETSRGGGSGRIGQVRSVSFQVSKDWGALMEKSAAEAGQLIDQ